MDRDVGIGRIRVNRDIGMPSADNRCAARHLGAHGEAKNGQNDEAKFHVRERLDKTVRSALGDEISRAEDSMLLLDRQSSCRAGLITISDLAFHARKQPIFSSGGLPAILLLWTTSDILMSSLLCRDSILCRYRMSDRGVAQPG